MMTKTYEIYSGSGAIQCQLARQSDQGTLVNFFKHFEDKKEGLGVKDYSVGLSTLEEVFLNLAKSAEEGNDEDDGEGDVSLFQKHNIDSIPTTAQFYALTMKTLVFQYRAPCTCLVIILFPLIILGKLRF